MGSQAGSGGNIPQFVRDQGLCFICREQPRVDAKRCQACLEAHEAKNKHRTRDYYREKHARLHSEGKCVKCEKLNSNGLKNCDECLAGRRQKTVELKESGKCLGCRETKDADGYSYCEACRTEFIPDSAERNLALKLETMKAYGGVECVCCKVKNHVVLNIDHVNDDGSQHRKVTGGGGQKTYYWLRDNGYPPGYQVLCFNCNTAKYRLGRMPTPEELQNPFSLNTPVSPIQYEPFVYPF